MSDLISRVRDARNAPAVTQFFPRGWMRAVGFEYATLVALIFGLPLSKGRIRREGELIVLTGLPEWAFRRGGTTVGRVYLTRDNDGDDVIRHEKVHLEQWRKYGFWMPLLYALAGTDPTKNRFEIEAGLEDGGYKPKKSRPRARHAATGSATTALTPENPESDDDSTL